MLTGWRRLGNELDLWAGANRVATLWWRDDDVACRTRSLSRMLDLRSQAGIPLAVAAIPAAFEEGAAACLRDNGAIDILQHGYAHHNHAPADERKSELGAQRQLDAALDELDAGARRLGKLMGQSFLKVLVPPWNRIADTLVGRLGDVGFVGISTYGARRDAYAAPGLTQVNTHVDIIDWRGTRRFVGTDVALTLAIDHLRARRTGASDDGEPTGLLSHHLAHDEAAWRFIDTFVETTRRHPAALWISAREAFAGEIQ